MIPIIVDSDSPKKQSPTSENKKWGLNTHFVASPFLVAPIWVLLDNVMVNSNILSKHNIQTLQEISIPHRIYNGIIIPIYAHNYSEKMATPLIS